MRRRQHKSLARKIFNKSNCFWAVKDKENFPHNVAAMSNWDVNLMPQWCGKWKPLLHFYVFSRPFGDDNELAFIGAYSDPETCFKIEKSVSRPIAVSNLVEFKQDVAKRYLASIVNNLPIKLPLDDSELTHQVVWDMLQGQTSDTDRFTTLNIWDWLRSLFAHVGDTHKYAALARWGAYKRTSVITAIKDLRSEKYAKGPVIDIRSKPGFKYFMPTGTMQKADKENDQKIILQAWDNKFFTRVK